MLTSEQIFPILETKVVKGEEFIVMDHNVFYALFNTLMENSDFNGNPAIAKVNKDYNDSLKIKRRRIRSKKLKSASQEMYGLMDKMNTYNKKKKGQSTCQK